MGRLQLRTVRGVIPVRVLLIEVARAHDAATLLRLYFVTVRPAGFEQQLRWLHRRGLWGTSIRELLTARRGRSRELTPLESTGQRSLRGGL